MAVASDVSMVAVPLSVTAGAPTEVGSMGDKTITLESAGTATYQLQISCDQTNPPASTTWSNLGAALTASGAIYIQQPCAWVRWNCTAYSNGTPTSRVLGLMRY